MGYYADLEIEREIRETGERIMREHMRADEIHGARKQKRKCSVDLTELRAFAAEPDDPLVVTTPSENHVQLRMDGKVFAEWWPSKGTTMADGKRGPVCKTVTALVEWLRGL